MDWKEYERLACVEHTRLYSTHTTLHWSEIPHEWLVDSVYFQDGRHLKNFMDFVFSQNVLEEDLARPAMYRLYEGIDSGVYGISRMHRMPLCSKLGEVRPLEIISGHPFDACLITVCPPGLGRVVGYVVPTQE